MTLGEDADQARVGLLVYGGEDEELAIDMDDFDKLELILLFNVCPLYCFFCSYIHSKRPVISAFNPFSTGAVSICQNLMSTEVRF